MVAALFIQRAFDPETQLYFGCVVVTVIISIVLHELAHGWAAIWQGDDTPRIAGHMTPDPMVHMGGMSLLMLALRCSLPFLSALAFLLRPLLSLSLSLFVSLSLSPSLSLSLSLLFRPPQFYHRRDTRYLNNSVITCLL